MRKKITYLLVICFLVAAWFLWIDVSVKALRPKGNTLLDHLTYGEPIQNGRVIRAAGKKYLVLFGAVRPFPRFPSGPPAYIFDADGKLVDWTSDIGENEKFHQQWLGQPGDEPATLEVIGDWLKAAK